MSKAVIAFVPVIHSGYIKFFSENKDNIFILGRDFLSDLPYLSREMRMLEPEVAAKLISDISGKARVINRDNLSEIHGFSEIIMPDEDVSRVFAENNLADKKITFEKVFLRWDKLISLKELEISPDRIVSMDNLDRDLIGKAFAEAEKSSDWWRQIGAVVTKEGKVTITGYNKHLPSNFSPYINGDPRNNFDAGIRFDLCTSIHAEAATIAIAAKNGIKLDGCFVYVTTFPCPTCARLLAEAGIKKIYYSKGYSLLDAEEILKGYGVEIILVK